MLTHILGNHLELSLKTQARRGQSSNFAKITSYQNDSFNNCDISSQLSLKIFTQKDNFRMFGKNHKKVFKAAFSKKVSVLPIGSPFLIEGPEANESSFCLYSF